MKPEEIYRQGKADALKGKHYEESNSYAGLYSDTYVFFDEEKD